MEQTMDHRTSTSPKCMQRLWRSCVRYSICPHLRSDIRDRARCRNPGGAAGVAVQTGDTEGRAQREEGHDHEGECIGRLKAAAAKENMPYRPAQPHRNSRGSDAE